VSDAGSLQLALGLLLVFAAIVLSGILLLLTRRPRPARRETAAPIEGGVRYGTR
jgi:hypothetical protein